MRGISDLQARLVRTPLPAVETFREDPLRLLRAVRFATRFDCSIDPSIFAAARIPEIERFLSVKVSRERIGIEFLKMAQFRHFDRALHELSNMDILNSLFHIEGDLTFYMKNQKLRSMEEFGRQLFLCYVPKVRKRKTGLLAIGGSGQFGDAGREVHEQLLRLQKALHRRFPRSGSQRSRRLLRAERRLRVDAPLCFVHSVANRRRRSHGRRQRSAAERRRGAAALDSLPPARSRGAHRRRRAFGECGT